jgi:hypothetical protein
MRLLVALSLSTLLLPAWPGSAAAQAGDTVVIYRCTDAQGRLSLRDSPCARGERQETRSMARPKDAPPRPAPPPPRDPMTVAVAQSPPQIIVVQPPRPLYECVTPDNARYVSDSPEGNPRQVPAWALGAPLFGQAVVHEPGRVDFRVENGRVSGNYRSGSIGTVWVPTPAAYGDTVWVRDSCYALPPVEVCSRLRERRDELRRRYTIAQPSERARLGREERGIEARLQQDCR